MELFFSQKREAEMEFLEYAKVNHIENCPMNVLAWLQGSGKKWLKILKKE